MALKQSLLLLAVIVIAGCTGLSPGIPSGVKIQQFYADPNQIYAGEQVTFVLNVQNIGSSDATEGVAQMYRLGPDWTYPSNNAIQSIGSLQPGANKTLLWILNSPTSISTSTRTDYANVRIYYKYTSDASATLDFITLTYLNGLNTTERNLVLSGATLTQQSTTNSPIIVNFSTSGNPLVVTGDNQPFSFFVTVSNIGQGTPLDNSSPYTTQTDFSSLIANKVFMTISSSFPDQSPGPQLFCSYLDPTTYASSITNQIKILSNNQVRISCQIYVSPIQIPGGRIDFHVAVELGYGYYLDNSTSIIITKTPF